MTRLIQRLLASAVLSIGMVAATVGASYGQDKVVRIGFQKYGKLVLLKSKGTLEEKLKSAGYKVVWTEFPSGPPVARSAQRRRDRFRQYRRSAADFRAGRGRADPVRRLRAAGAERRGDPGAEGQQAEFGRRP